MRDADSDERKLGLNLRPHLRTERVDDYMPDGAPYIKAPCYTLSGDPGGGISGSPVFRHRTGRVHGVVCRGNTSIDPSSKPYTIALSVRAFVDDWPIPFLDGRSLREHAACGAISVW